MKKPKRKRTAAEKAARRRRREEDWDSEIAREVVGGLITLHRRADSWDDRPLPGDGPGGPDRKFRRKP